MMFPHISVYFYMYMCSCILVYNNWHCHFKKIRASAERNKILGDISKAKSLKSLNGEQTCESE